jgi:hypothetical protein
MMLQDAALAVVGAARRPGRLSAGAASQAG